MKKIITIISFLLIGSPVLSDPMTRDLYRATYPQTNNYATYGTQPQYQQPVQYNTYKNPVTGSGYVQGDGHQYNTYTNPVTGSGYIQGQSITPTEKNFVYQMNEKLFHDGQ